MQVSIGFSISFEQCVSIQLYLKVLQILNLFWTLNCYFHEMSSQFTSYVSKFYPQVHLWLRHWYYHNSNRQTVKYTCITLYNHTVHCNIRNRAQSVRRQHRKRTSEESEIVTYKDTTQWLRNMWVSFIYTISLGWRGHHIWKWLMIY